MNAEKKLKYFMLNNLGVDWIWQAENEEEATKDYISEVGEDGSFDNIEWKECGKYGFKGSEEILTDCKGTRYHYFVFDNGEEI